MTRKNFIKSASLLAGGAVAAPALARSSPLNAKSTGNTLKLKKGVSFYMIKEELSLVDKCKLVMDIGFDGVEFNSPVDFGLDELLDAKGKSGIEIPSLVNKDHWSKPLSDPDPEVRQFTIDSVAKSLEEVKDRKSTRLNSSHVKISYAVFCLKKKIQSTNSLALSRTHVPCINKP